MKPTGAVKWEPSCRKKKLPLFLASLKIHCLTKAEAFVPQCSSGPIYWYRLLLSHIAWLAALAMQCDTPKAYSSWWFQFYSFSLDWI